MFSGGKMDTVKNRVSIRRMKFEDADAVSHIYCLITQNTVDEKFKKRVQSHSVSNENEAPFVAELDGKVIGFMISYVLKLGFEAEKSAYIATMGIHPKHMGQTIGVAMIKEVFDFYKSLNITRVYTSVRWDATDILSFFKTVDFGRSKLINLKRNLNQLSPAIPTESSECRQSP